MVDDPTTQLVLVFVDELPPPPQAVNPRKSKTTNARVKLHVMVSPIYIITINFYRFVLEGSRTKSTGQKIVPKNRFIIRK